MNEELVAASVLLVQSGALKRIGNLNSAFEKGDSLLEQMLTGSQFH
jgi:hypothetical protein